MKIENIKFKAKRLDNGEWVKGSLVNTPFGTFILWYEGATCHKKEVNPETVCQRTGMRDCCGVDIYEHDMLEYDLGPFSKTRDVMWLNGTYQLNLEPLYSYISHGIQVKVVGNLIDKCY